MKSVEIFVVLNDFTLIKDFVTRAQSCEGDIDISSTDNRYTVDAKSIMGVFSLDLSKPVRIIFHNRDDYERLMSYITAHFSDIAVNENK